MDFRFYSVVASYCMDIKYDLSPKLRQMIFQKDLPCLSDGFLAQPDDSLGVHSLNPVTGNTNSSSVESLGCRGRQGERCALGK